MSLVESISVGNVMYVMMGVTDKTPARSIPIVHVRNRRAATDFGDFTLSQLYEVVGVAFLLTVSAVLRINLAVVIFGAAMIYQCYRLAERNAQCVVVTSAHYITTIRPTEEVIIYIDGKHGPFYLMPYDGHN